MKKKWLEKTVLNTVCGDFNLSLLFKFRHEYLAGKDTLVCGQDGRLFVRANYRNG